MLNSVWAITSKDMLHSPTFIEILNFEPKFVVLGGAMVGELSLYICNHRFAPHPRFQRSPLVHLL